MGHQRIRSAIAFLAGIAVCIGTGPVAAATETGSRSVQDRNEKGRTLESVERENLSIRIAFLERDRARAEGMDLFLRMAVLPGDSSACVVFDKSLGICGMQAAEFNRTLPALIPDGVDSLEPGGVSREVFKARSRALEGYAQRAYEKWLERTSPDSAELGRNADTNLRSKIDNQPGVGRLAAYRKAYSEDPAFFFRLQPFERIEFYASTDSSLIAGIRASLSGHEGFKRATSGFRASVIGLAEVPEPFIPHLEKAGPGKWTLPFRVSYGFILARAVLPAGRALRGFEDFVPLLRMAHELPFPQAGKGDLALRADYERNWGKSKQDTFWIELELVPVGPASKGMRVRAVRIAGDSVPAPLGAHLQRLREVGDTVSFASPIGNCRARRLSSTRAAAVPDLGQAKLHFERLLEAEILRAKLKEATAVYSMKRSSLVRHEVIRMTLAGFGSNTRVAGNSPEAEYLQEKAAMDSLVASRTAWIRENLGMPDWYAQP